MKTSIRIVTLATVFLFALAASHAFGGTKATRNVSSSPFVFDVSLTADGPATLEFGVTDKNNVPYPPIGTPADASLKHIFFVGSGLPEVGSAADYSQLACNFLSGDTPQVWKLQSLADTTVYFSLKEGEDPGDLTIDDGESEAVELHDGTSAKLVKGKSYYIRRSVEINPIGTIRTSMLKGATTVKVPFPEGYVIAPNGWEDGKTLQVFAYDADGKALFTDDTPTYPDGAIELSCPDLTVNPFTVTNLPENAAYFQFGFDYTKDGETLNSLVVVDVTTPVAVTLTSIEYGAYDAEGAVVVEDEQELHGTADPASTAVLSVPASTDSRDGYVKLVYNVSTIEDGGPSTFDFFVDCLPLTELYTVVTDANAPLGATQIKCGDADPVFATLAGEEYTFNGMNMPAGSEATLTVVLKVEQGAEQANVIPSLIIAGNEWPMTSLYILPVDNSGTLDFDGDGDIDNDDAMYLYNFVLNDCPGDEDADWFTGESIMDFTTLDTGSEEDIEKANSALACLRKSMATLVIDFDEDGAVDNNDAMYLYNYVLNDCPGDADADWFTGESIMDFTTLDAGNEEDIAKANAALAKLRKLASKVTGN